MCQRMIPLIEKYHPQLERQDPPVSGRIEMRPRPAPLVRRGKPDGGPRKDTGSRRGRG